MNEENNYLEIFEPFEKLIEIEISGKTIKVPENNMLLRCFQYLSMESISMGEFCWNGDCANCQVWLEGTTNEKPVLACRTRVWEGMKIKRLSREIEIAELTSG